MRDAPTRQRLSGFTFLMLAGRARPIARAGLRTTWAAGRALVLFAMLLLAHPGGAHAAEGPFILIDLGSFGGLFSNGYAVKR
jgi:hypothetical protein